MLVRSPASLQALTELGVELDVLWGTIERVHRQARGLGSGSPSRPGRCAAPRSRRSQEKEFERAAGLRDQGRELTEQAQAQIDLPPNSTLLLFRGVREG